MFLGNGPGRKSTRWIPMLLILFTQSVALSAQVGFPSPDTLGTGAVTTMTGAEASLLDAPVDAETYMLGPGDRLDMSIFGALNSIVPVSVAPGGQLVIPGIGIVDVRGLTLEKAEEKVRAAVLRLYQNVGVHLTLAGVRRFKVYLAGNVATPGVRIASATTRVSEVLPALPAASGNTYLERNILVRREGNDSMRVDLARFRLAGRVDANPIVQEGDVLIVPVVNERVYVYGRVSYPGAFEFRPGESLADLLWLANGGGGFALDAADTLRLSRSVRAEEQVQYAFTREQAAGDEGQSFVLRPGDAVYVPRANDREPPLFAAVEGEVARPGRYPITPGVTTVRDLISLSGGLQPDASLAGATLQRTRVADDTIGLSSLRAVPPELLSSRERRLLVVGQVTAPRNVIIDFQRLLFEGADAYNQPVEAGDVLSIPELIDDITVLGAVAEPGVVAYRAGAGVSGFVALAGGYTKKADRSAVTIVRANSTTRFDASEIDQLRPGDLILVPYKENRDLLRLLQTTSTVVTTATGLILTFLAVFR